MERNCLIDKAMRIATMAHEGQVDKAGKEYILHPLRVSGRCSSLDEKIVALLHDVIEDGGITRKVLEQEGFESYIIDAIESVTRRDGESYESFIKRCSSNAIGRKVKMRDLEDNMDITRLNEISDKDIIRLKKYHRAYKYLENI